MLPALGLSALLHLGSLSGPQEYLGQGHRLLCAAAAPAQLRAAKSTLQTHQIHCWEGMEFLHGARTKTAPHWVVFSLSPPPMGNCSVSEAGKAALPPSVHITAASVPAHLGQVLVQS